MSDHEYTEEQIRADIQLVEQSDLDDDLALALMRLAHALCGSSMLRGLVARTHRQNAIVRAIVEKRGTRISLGEAIAPFAGMLANEAAAEMVDARASSFDDRPIQHCFAKPFLGFRPCCGGVVEGDRAHRCGPIPDGCPGCGGPRAPGSWCCSPKCDCIPHIDGGKIVHGLLCALAPPLAEPEPAAHCGMCSAEYTAAEYAVLDSARASHFRGCTKCGHYEVVPS